MAYALLAFRDRTGPEEQQFLGALCIAHGLQGMMGWVKLKEDE